MRDETGHRRTDDRMVIRLMPGQPPGGAEAVQEPRLLRARSLDAGSWTGLTIWPVYVVCPWETIEFSIGITRRKSVAGNYFTNFQAAIA
jgi:hypothetical protein